MIGVIADPKERDVVREFFELFKTPWEFYRRDRDYDVLLCAGEGQFDAITKLIVFYSGKKTMFDREQRTPVGAQRKCPNCLMYQGNRLPIYGELATFAEKGSSFLAVEGGQKSAVCMDRADGKVLVRIGYDLFSEVRTLLTEGQPAAYANIPTLELHVALFRDLITGNGIELVEIPPVPEGYRFIACLTHDVDHPLLCRHKWDRTMFGFLYRAVFGSLWRFVWEQMPARDVLKNWMAALKVPLVYLGLARDFWLEFADRYLELQRGIPTTYFVIPFKNRQGIRGDNPSGAASRFRASRYEAQDIAETIQKLRAAGNEIGLHGIDAWVDSSRGREELSEIQRLTGVSETGVRMHWLYFDRESPAALEEAGASYDSTVGYNEAVGYRAGTTQVYKPLGTNRLLELPLHIMDTALFYRSYLGLSPRQAKKVIQQMAGHAADFGGVLTINWHDRSVVPERLWDTFYRDVIQDLERRGAWFSTARDTISWFQKRRTVTFESDPNLGREVRARVSAAHEHYIPGLRLRIHKAGELESNRNRCAEDYIDVAIGNSEVCSPPVFRLENK